MYLVRKQKDFETIQRKNVKSLDFAKQAVYEWAGHRLTFDGGPTIFFYAEKDGYLYTILQLS